ncbi:uncharacterized protein LOC126820449 [Patella vulgata]|uniref:uncharacterized protein LOC126820449 n=1 Tax=Patella vulgata TaxID=6465 RepID=UPI0024A8B2A3|nr:uncharacterized protein LOC126820449 [Patella vulgata]
MALKACFVALCVATLVPTLVPSAVIWDYDCLPTDCSQGKRNYPGDEKFVCSIGHQNECDIAKYIKNPGTTTNLNFAKLSHVELYSRTHDKFKGPYRALNISFTLPNYDNRALDAIMILAHFWSPPGRHMEIFYNKNPRCRLFDFSITQLSKVDLQHPREINYPCLVGLSEVSSRHMYTINLTVVPFATVTNYYVTTYSYVNDYKCITASAIAVLQNTIHVVFDASSGASHTVRLYKNSNPIASFNTSSNQYEFSVHDPGEYQVGIRPIPYQRTCQEMSTESISFPAKEKNLDGDSSENISKIVFSVVALISLCLITGIILVIRKLHVIRKNYHRKRAERSNDYTCQAMIPLEPNRTVRPPKQSGEVFQRMTNVLDAMARENYSTSDEGDSESDILPRGFDFIPYNN